MQFEPHLAAIRFGTGLSPVIAPPRSSDDMLALLTGPDQSATDWYVPPHARVRPTMAEFRQMNRDRRAALGTSSEVAAVAAYDAMRHDVLATQQADFKAVVARQITTQDALRERLVLFWADHFTVRARNVFSRHLIGPFVEDAIRPHVAGRFADMLTAVITHPEMLFYLDQMIRWVRTAREHGVGAGD